MHGKIAEVVFVAIVFAICGAGSSVLWEYPGKYGGFVIAVPFSLLVAAVCVRTFKAILVLPLFVAVWWIASMTAFWALEFTHNAYLGLGFAGAVGGLGVALAGATVQSRFRHLSATIGAAIAGFAGGLPSASG